MHALLAALTVLVLLVASFPTLGQTTAGSSTVIVVPVTAQTASFASEVTVYNPNGAAVTVDVAFYEANNVVPPAVSGPKTCTDVAVPAGKSVQFNLAGQCALGAGSHFGLLVLSELAGTKPIHGFARVQNPQGIGFSVEGFPAENFNNQVSHANGLKKTTSGMIYQTNCFAGSLASGVNYTLNLFDGTSGIQIGSTINGSLAAFQQIRYLDVFGPAGVNAANVDQLNVRAEFASTNHALLVGFCTVQDNTSFGADFRIAKSYGTTAAFVQGGNSFGTTAVLGTSDNRPMEIWVNSSRSMRYEPNSISPNLIGGSPANNVTAGVRGATIGGGGVWAEDSDPDFFYEAPNRVTDAYGTVGGGYANRAGNDAGTTTDAAFATVGGGLNNVGSNAYSTIGGGSFNTASGYDSTIGGGHDNDASVGWATVGGGLQNTASGDHATVGGGYLNAAIGASSTIVGGAANHAVGVGSIVVGGSSNWARGDSSFAAGHGADANADNCAIFSIWDTYGAGMSCFGSTSIFRVGANHGFSVDYFARRVDGGGEHYFYVGDLFFAQGRAISTSQGGYLSHPGGQWVGNSDVERKSNFAVVDKHDLLQQVIALPIGSWRYIGEPEEKRHIGPMAQDFWTAFRLGDDDRHIGTLDEAGVALAAIQGLNAKLEAKLAAQARQIEDLEARLSRTELVQAEMAAMKAAVAQLQHDRASVATR